MAVQHKSKIEIDVLLDENKIPEQLHWTAEDGGIEARSEGCISFGLGP